ncbi:hypothetical protein HN51_034022 [Arachis hypogaea]|uniref:uncharacterized protein LOC107629137 n=1 Tax=Arachis ipaensis TaxID=130454 RepID=UPI0007AF0019|nr:uncharacterized protein LOC107629137 [Arachis ipaensis]XP_020973483.1 uncharacterized protein LOC107629137 [Arachis ipaensis]XP_025641901.1 uncharacterized protein LOC112736598 [Arachis hypogaea]XP_025641902.1 uncharacterized protein LOC112736598 [Arachis hypogaea]QHN98800.1 uncharacterized protein DS421_13g392590 [Arachis hypogaea]
MACENENGRKEEEKSLPLVNTDDDNKMASVESEISEKEKDELRQLYEEVLRRRGGPFRRRRPERAHEKRGVFEGHSNNTPNKMASVESEISGKGKDEVRGPEILYPPRREIELAVNVTKLRSELIVLGLFDEESRRRTTRDQFTAPSSRPFQQDSKGEAS